MTPRIPLALPAHSPSFQGGVRVATGDVSGDGAADLVSAAGPRLHFFVFDPSFRRGLFVSGR